MADDTFNPTAAELAQINLLIGKGMTFTLPKKSPLRFLSKKKERTFHIKPPYVQTMVHLAKELIQIDLDKTALETDYFNEMKRVVVTEAERSGRIIAIMVLRDDWKIKWFLPLVSHYLLSRITPAMLRGLTERILTIANLPDFIHSIGLLSIQKRVTSPAPMENPDRED